MNPQPPPFSTSLAQSDPYGTIPPTLEIAVDTEFQGPHTLTVQAACRQSNGDIALQLYRSQYIPAPPAEMDLLKVLGTNQSSGYAAVLQKSRLLPTQLLDRDLCIGRIVLDLLNLSSGQVLPRNDVLTLVEKCKIDGFSFPFPTVTDGKTEQIPTIEVHVIGHFLYADLFRIFGTQTLAQLLGNRGPDKGAITVSDNKLLKLHENGRDIFSSPIVCFILLPDRRLFGIRVGTFDTMRPFISGSLDALSSQFLGVGKHDVLTSNEKGEMFTTFHRRPADAYLYACIDVVNTLLIHEQMTKVDRDLNLQLGIPEQQLPKLKNTLGSRVASSLFECVQQATKQSARLSSKPKLRDLFRRGGLALFESDQRCSRYGMQTGLPHGGLLLSRSSTKFWHEAPGMLRDVDLAGCYPAIASQMSLYVGRPRIFEPGNQPLNLQQAVELASSVADNDAWFIRATGTMHSTHNVLIPSTLGAITSENFTKVTRKRRKTGQQPADRHGAKLFSERIESGIVTAATYSIIETLPEAVRNDYRQLSADSIVFYPRSLTAQTGEDFDAKCDELESADLPWSSILNVETFSVQHQERVNDDHVAFKYPLGDLFTKISNLRAEAKKRDGAGAASEQSLKLHANTMYGILASSFFDVGNFMAANQITAAGRAIAFAMIMSLNGIQVITDGCTYRRDQIPACTYAECLEIAPDYPLRRAEAGMGIPFIPAHQVPTGDDEFTDWYRRHANFFFQIQEETMNDWLSIHKLAHKKNDKSDRADFDALFCSGCGDYAKLSTTPEGSWQAEGSALRSYKKEAVDQLVPWLVEVASRDNLLDLPPIVEQTNLLRLKKATQKANAALNRDIATVYFPLGMPAKEIRNINLLKASAFICKDEQQFRKLEKAFGDFKQDNHCGVELLALRQSYGNRSQGSIHDLAERVFELVNSGDTKFVRALNLNRLSSDLQLISQARGGQIRARKQAADQELFREIDVQSAECSMEILTGYIVRKE